MTTMTSTENPTGDWAHRPILLLLVLAGLLIGFLAFKRMAMEASAIVQRAPLPMLGVAPKFTLTDQADRMFMNDKLSGMVWVVDFIFTRCAGPCPKMTQRMSEFQNVMAGLDDFRLVTFTVDPEYDTPAKLAEYGEAFGADPGRWAFLTGARQKIHELCINGFKLAVGKDPSDENNILHSTRFVLVDRKGRIRGYYDETEPKQMTQLAGDIQRLIDEPGS